MGIDFGIVNTIYLAFNNNKHHYRITTAPVNKLNRKLFKGYDYTYDMLDNFNYKTALHIVNLAIKHHTSIIQMEDLKGTSFTSNSFYFELQRNIQAFAEEKSINTKYVNRDFSSQKCSVCGFIDKKNRVDQNTFICLKCGANFNADYNAAKNIANSN